MYAPHLRALRRAARRARARASSRAGERGSRRALALVAVCAGLRLLDQEGLWLGLLQFVPTLVLLLRARRGRATPRCRSYVAGGETPPAVAVALHDELRRNPPERLSPALLLHGALRAHLRREKPDRARTVVLELGPGAGYATAPSAAARPRREAAGRRTRACGGGRGCGACRTLWIGATRRAERSTSRSRASTRSTPSWLDATRLH